MVDVPVDDDGGWSLALQALCRPHPAAVDQLCATAGRIRATGAQLFEVVSGTPATSYGARLTFRPGVDQRAFDAAAGLSDHPWGPPDWIGVRTRPDGAVHCKAYHRHPPQLAFAQVHRGLPPGSEPVMAALDGGSVEVYAVFPGQISWETFGRQCLVPFGGTPAEPGVRLTARARGFGVSVKQLDETIEAISLFAFAEALPNDDQVTASWLAQLSSDEADQHDVAMGAVASLGKIIGRRHALLAWTYERSGLAGRAASLRAPLAPPTPAARSADL